MTRMFRLVGGPVRTAIALALGITLGAGGLALGDIAVSQDGTPSGTVLTCTGKLGAMRYVRHGGCRRGEGRLVLSERAPLVATLPPAGFGRLSPGVSLYGPPGVPGAFELQLSPSVVADVRNCAISATALVPPEGGQITHAAEVSAAPLDRYHVVARVSDPTGDVTADGISIAVFCP